MKTTRKILRGLIVILGVAIIGLIGWHWMAKHGHHQHHQAMVVPAEGFGSVHDFEFTNQQGKKFGSTDLKGKLWVANFIFTRCAGPCPIMSAKMARLQSEYPANTGLNFVSFSVDPEYDSPPVLDKYAQSYGAEKDRWYFLTGAREKIYKTIRESFQLAVQEQMHAGHGNMMDVLHSLHFVLVDPAGKILGYFNSNDAEAMADLKSHLNERTQKKAS